LIELADEYIQAPPLPPDIISYAVWLYYRFNLSHRDIEDLLAQRRITVSREAIRLWCIKFGGFYARRLKRKHRGYGDKFFLDEVFAGVPDLKINGNQHYLWRAVDQDGEVVDVFLQARRDGAAVTTRQQSVSSIGYCDRMEVNPGRL
jgi:putative transposase